MTAPAAPQIAPNAPQPVALAVAAGAVLALALWAAADVSPRAAAVFLMGCALGFALYRASFGFAGTWRAFVASGRSRGFRGTCLTMGVAAAIVMPLVNGGGYAGAVDGMGGAFLIGALMFGVGMQLGGGCASGVAFTAGGGAARNMVALVAFVAGSVIGSVHVPWWNAALPPVARLSLVEAFGLPLALGLTLAALGALALAARAHERRRNGAVFAPPPPPPAPLARRALFGPWTTWEGCALMGLLTGAVALLTGAIWGVTFGYALWGAKALHALGFDLAAWTFPGHDVAFWAQGWAAAALREPLFRNDSAATNVGLLLGAAVAAGMVGRWRPSLSELKPGPLAAALIGGLIMGYGARLSHGCTIGALVGGVTSGSLHGWVWGAVAFIGTWPGLWARRALGVPD
jgi:uncharacterized membrane protein YedE/YeeE